MQNKANVNIGKINISIVTKKDYDKEQRTTNNDRYSKQTQTKPISNATTVFLLITQEIAAVLWAWFPRPVLRSSCATEGGSGGPLQ